ncbi:hypothetical protein GPA23_20345, partial [Aromatoleum aromaticum]|nr:hypothetical protein [Aromatoleum aromaticum]
LNLIRLDKSIKTSIKTKRLLAATSDEFRAALLGFQVPEEDEDALWVKIVVASIESETRGR